MAGSSAFELHSFLPVADWVLQVSRSKELPLRSVGPGNSGVPRRNGTAAQYRSPLPQPNLQTTLPRDACLVQVELQRQVAYFLVLRPAVHGKQPGVRRGSFAMNADCGRSPPGYDAKIRQAGGLRVTRR